MSNDVVINWIFCHACKDRGLEDMDCKFHRDEDFSEKRFFESEYVCPRCKSVTTSLHISGMTQKYAEHLKSRAEDMGGGGGIIT